MDIAVFPFGVVVFSKEKIIDKFTPKEPVDSWMKKEINKKTEEFLKKYEGDMIQITPNLIKKYGLKLKVFKKQKFTKYLNSFYIDLTKNLIKQKLTREEFLIQGVESIEEINKTINLVYERLIEWFGLYFPESLTKIKNIEDFIKLADLKRKKSFGIDAKEIDIKIINEGFNQIKELINYKEKITNYVESLMKEFYPNLSDIATPLVGAKLISLAKGIKNLTRMASSKIQIIGAEKALFRYLKTGKKPPKHGAIFKHPLISKAKKSKRGKVARVLASKISICAKMDFYGTEKEYGKKILKEIEKKLGDMDE